MATDAEIVRSPRVTWHRAGAFRVHWSPAAWTAGALGVLFAAATCWWLVHDRSVPVDDAALHLGFAIDAYENVGSGHLLKALTESAPYPPLTYLVGAVGILFGGVGVAPPIIALNVVFVLLLALGCYNVGRLTFGPLAGVLAVVFALGSPLVIEEFHEFMLDAPEAAMVAISAWAILATDRFLRFGVCALAGVAVGLGMLSKESFAFFVAGLVLASAVRGGRRAWRGIAIFGAVALVIALPWYLYELSTIHALGGEALGSSSTFSGPGVFPGVAPPRLSATNLEWYFWGFLNWQLFLPLSVFSAVGIVWTMVGFARRRPVSRRAVELALGGFVSWAALTETYIHDIRYSLPMTVYLAVFAAGWISRLPRPLLAGTATILVIIALANTLGVGFGIGTPVMTAPTNAVYEQQPGTLTFYSSHGLWMGKPTRDGDVLGLFRALRRNGIRELSWSSENEGEVEFSGPGLAVLARIAGLSVPTGHVEPDRASRYRAFVSHGEPPAGLPSPCVILRDGSGVWIRLGGSRGISAWDYCPLRRS
jgi:4-amino-4-deoxy-L-arabinose transferase-like glycosyltransferase